MRPAWEPVRPTEYPRNNLRPGVVLYSGPIPTGRAGKILMAGVFLVAAVLLGRCTAPEPEPRHPDVIVPEESITEDEPQLDPSIGDRLRKRVVQPVQVATAPRGGDAELRAFCSAQVAAAVQSGPAVPGPELDTTPPVPAPKTIFLARSSRTDPGWWWGKDETVVTGLLSTGGLREITTRHYRGAEWRSDDRGGISLRENRWGRVRGYLEFGVPLVGGYMLGRLTR